MINYEEEKRLLGAVLTDALDCIVKQRKGWEKEFAWFNSEDTTPVRSFVWICDSLGLEPECVRDIAMQVIDNPKKFIGRFKDKAKCPDLLSTYIDQEVDEDEEWEQPTSIYDF